MDKIVLKGMSFFGRHGVTAAEREVGHQFVIDADIYVDLAEAGRTDEISKTVDYNDVYGQIAAVVTGNSFFLLEKLAEELAEKILSNHLVEKVELRVKKLSPPIAGQVKSTAVVIARGR